MENPVEQLPRVDDGDAVRSKLPESKKLGFWSNTFILWGLVLVVSSLLVGGLVGSQLPFKEAMIVIIMAGIFNSIIAILIEVIGARTGYTSAMIFRYSYGKIGVILPNLIIGFYLRKERCTKQHPDSPTCGLTRPLTLRGSLDFW